MSDKAASLFGWDLLYSTVESDIKSNQDVLLCYVHLVLISNGFKCIGLGDSKNFDGNESKSESLPKGWNDGYAIRYVHQGRLYNLKATALDDGIIINIIRVDERNVSMIQLNTRAVAQRSGSLDQMIPENLSIMEAVRKQLIEKITVSTKTKDSSSQTTNTNIALNQNIPSDIHIPSPLFEPPRIPRQPFGGPLGPLNVGRSDLDPFGMNPLAPAGGFQGVGGGGMLFVPPQGPRFEPGGNLGVPGGSLPPGARFDPFRPPDVDRFPRRPNNPDNDEMPPPRFDNMFM